MKEIYVCEKCGAQFDDFNAAYKCEDSHLLLENVWSDVQPELNKRAVWANGDAAPASIVMFTERYNRDTGNYDRVFYTYKRGKALTDKEVAEINAERDARKAREEADREAWRKEMEAKKAREEAEAASAEAAS